MPELQMPALVARVPKGSVCHGMQLCLEFESLDTELPQSCGTGCTSAHVQPSTS